MDAKARVYLREEKRLKEQASSLAYTARVIDGSPIILT